MRVDNPYDFLSSLSRLGLGHGRRRIRVHILTLRALYPSVTMAYGMMYQIASGTHRLG